MDDTRPGTSCRRDQAFRGALERLVRDDDTRRELLWYRAKEKEDEWMIRMLEEHASVRARVADAEVRLAREGYDLTRPEEARAGFAKLFLERVRRGLGEYESVPCGCARCARSR